MNNMHPLENHLLLLSTHTFFVSVRIAVKVLNNIDRIDTD